MSFMIYRMPAEWEPHAATWLAWPKNPTTWPGRMEAIPPVWIAMITALNEPVHLLVDDESTETLVRVLLRIAGVAGDCVIFHHIPTDDAWIRDFAPTFVRGNDSVADSLLPPDNPRIRTGEARSLFALNWIYNAWGEKYPPWAQDARAGGLIAAAAGVELVQPGFVLEGGSIEVNGSGTLMTTEQCLLNKNRNPHLSRADIEARLRTYLGVRQIIWLKEGIAGDDTDGHIDDIARFVGSRTVVAAVESDPADENYRPLRENFEFLQGQRDERGRPLQVISLPMPRPIEYQGMRLPASYANFCIANGVVLVPVFDDPNDAKALEILSPLFPGRCLAPILCRDVVIGLGGVHCVTQQQPL